MIAGLDLSDVLHFMQPMVSNCWWISVFILSVISTFKTTSLPLGQFSGQLKTEMYLHSYYVSLSV